jgi:hypothetical protein
MGSDNVRRERGKRRDARPPVISKSIITYFFIPVNYSMPIKTKKTGSDLRRERKEEKRPTPVNLPLF